jgi:carboxypeptidase C (cathepsin A)
MMGSDNTKDNDKGSGAELSPPEERVSVTHHRVTIAGAEIAYTATAGTILVKEEKEEDEKSVGEKAKASVFYVAYTRDDVEDIGSRPITFAFNGGPGSSSVWLHLGLLGPKRVLLEEGGAAPPPPYRLVDNDFSLLEVSDLVFVDPVSTGYSRAVPGEKAGQFHSFKSDIEWVGEFIRLYTSRSGRWSSPKFLIGESYGTTRAAGLSGYLQKRHGLYLNGLMLVSSILNFQTARFVPGNDLPYILFLPTYTASAWYHRRLPDRLQEDLGSALAEVSAFATGEYTLALMQGDALPEDAANELAAKLAEYTGLSADYIRRTNLRINIHRFTKELLRDEGRTIGRLDSRFKGVDRDAAGERNEFDPSYANIQGAYTATLNDYVRRELAFESDLPYEILTDRVHPWSWDTHQNEYANVAETLREAMSMNPHLQVLAANGYYDLATPYLATEYTVSHMGLDPELRSNVRLTYYEAGHMMYIHRPSLARLRADLGAFIQGASQEKGADRSQPLPG